MLEKSVIGLGVGNNEVKNSESMLHETVGDGFVSAPSRNMKRIILSLSKPSYALGLGLQKVRTQSRVRLRHVLCKLVRQHNWTDASGVLSVLLKGTCKDRSPVQNQMKYCVTMELLKHMGTDQVNSTKIKHLYEIWMRKIGSMKNWPVQKRFAVQLEFILFCLTQGNVGEAHQAALCIMQDLEFGSDPISNMVVGLTFYELWYSTIPKELQFRGVMDSDSPIWSDSSSGPLSNPAENSEGCDEVNFHMANPPFHCDSDTSVMKDKEISGAYVVLPREVSMKDVDCKREKDYQANPMQGFYMNSAGNTECEAASFASHDENMPSASIFSGHGWDSWLLPLRLPHSAEDFEGFFLLYREMFNDYFKNAVKYLRIALHSTPPVLAALHPLVQLLLLADQVKEALDELEMFHSNSSMAFSLRLKASVLEHYDRSNFASLSTCLEDTLRTDPTCSHSLAKLVNLHRNGDYSHESLLEMIALHLDATFADFTIWREFALCFLKFSQYDEDRMSVCLNGNKGGLKQRYSVRINRIPKIFTEGRSGKSWRLRCRWWLTRHFSKNMFVSDVAAGDLQLLTYKAACAAYMYGLEFEYVVEAYTSLDGEENRDLFLFLERHLQYSFGFYQNSE